MSALREQLDAYRAWRRRLQHAHRADQVLVDDLFSVRSGVGRRPSRERLQPTMAKVLQIVASSPEPVGAAEVAEQLGASRPTAQRYLAALLRRQLVDLDLAYGATGRPEHRYRVR